MARILDGRPVARAVLQRARDDLAQHVTRTGHVPSLTAVMVGADEGSLAYFRAIQRTCRRTGVACRQVELPADIPEHRFREVLADLRHDVTVNGIILLQPLPPHLPKNIASEVINSLKDVDGITPVSIGRLAAGMETFVPSTPAGGLEILRYHGISVEGRSAVVVGRSNVVGKPMALLLLAANATVTICHSHTRNLGAITRTADIIASATGKPGLVTAEMVKPGATVIDFGVNFVDGKLVGDVDPAVAEVAGAVTPVPGGTGLVTNAMLVRNTLLAAKIQLRELSKPVPDHSVQTQHRP